MEERELVRRSRQGDVHAYGELVRQHQKIAFRVAYLVTKDTPAAEDVIQEAFVRAYRAISSFHPEAPFKPWLLQIVRNEALKHLRSSRRKARVEFRAENDLSLRAGVGPSPEEELLASERRAALIEAVKALREEDRLVIVYRYFFDLSERETAEALACPRGTVKSRLSRSIAKLRNSLSTVTPDTRAKQSESEEARGV